MRCKVKATMLAVVSVVIIQPFISYATAGDDAALYSVYRSRFDAVAYEEDITANGFRVIESQVFDVEHDSLGILKIIPTIDEEYNRLALFFAHEDGAIPVKTDNFMANIWLAGQLRQTNRDVICISCVDLNGDGLQDIIAISSCQNGTGGTSGAYNVGDVLFQSEAGFYRDPRISDKINRFDMNKSAEYIQSFVSEGVSMEFLFVAKDFSELVDNGFQPINYLRVTEHLEKFGVVEVVPGFYKMMGQSYLMIYIIDQSGHILWDFQPMHHYENFYDILAISLKDVDGDGNKDLILLARYATYDTDGTSFVTRDYDIYYQRAGYFLEDAEFKNSYTLGEADHIDAITHKARQFWGWPQ